MEWVSFLLFYRHWECQVLTFSKYQQYPQEQEYLTEHEYHDWFTLKLALNFLKSFKMPSFSICISACFFNWICSFSLNVVSRIIWATRWDHGEDLLSGVLMVITSFFFSDTALTRWDFSGIWTGALLVVTVCRSYVLLSTICPTLDCFRILGGFDGSVLITAPYLKSNSSKQYLSSSSSVPITTCPRSSAIWIFPVAACDINFF